MNLSSAWRRVDRRLRRQLLWALAGAGVVMAGVGAGCFFHPPFGTFMRDSLALALGVMTTPFLLETTLFMAGIILVIAVGILRVRMEGEGWVSSDEDARPTAGTSAAPAAGHEVEAASDLLPLAVAEGYLELGLPDDAWDALVRVPRRDWDQPDVLAVRLRHCAVAQRWREGDGLATQLEQAGGKRHLPTVAAYLLAEARYLMAAPEGGEVPGPRAAARESRALVAKALALDPDSAATVTADPLLAPLAGV